MSDSIFYCFGVPVAMQRADGSVHRIKIAPEDRAHIEARLDVRPGFPVDRPTDVAMLPYITTPVDESTIVFVGVP